MNDRQLRYALAVWRERSFSRAAEKLGVSQPSLSEQVRNLEGGIGFSLFDRTSRGVEASNAGRAFLERAEDVLSGMAALEELAHELKGAPESTVRIGINSGLAAAYLPVVIEAVNSVVPACRLDLVTATTRRVQRLVAQKRLDAGLLIQGEIKAMPAEVERETFAETELVLLTRAGDTAALIEVEALARLPLVVNEPRIGYGRALMNEFDARSLEPTIVAVSDDLDTVKLMVRAGAGVAPVPRIAVARELAAGEFSARPIVPAQIIPLLLIKREEPLPPRVALCLELLRTRLLAPELAHSAAD